MATMKQISVIDVCVRILTEGFLDTTSHTLSKLYGNNVKFRLVSSTETDPNTNDAQLSEKVVLDFRSGVAKDTDTYFAFSFTVDESFGNPGAIQIDSHDTNEFFLKTITLTLSDGSTIYFPCYSWINHNKFNKDRPRYFFSNQLCLPCDTPWALQKIRKDELLVLRGDCTGERQNEERIYDYDVYNDLCDLDSDINLKRPILGGSAECPCPRRMRTGRACTKADTAYEQHMSGYNKTYVPRDERFTPLKKSSFMNAGIRSFSHSIISQIERFWQDDKSFSGLKHINSLYDSNLKAVRDRPPEQTTTDIPLLSFPTPAVIQANSEGWKTDHEFARERLAGANPHTLKRLTVFPPVSSLDPEVYGPPTSAITEDHIKDFLQTYTVEEAMERNLLYIVDYYDMYMPYLKRIHETEKRATYAPRALFYLTRENILLPVAIELALPPEEEGKEAKKRVFTPNTHIRPDWLWQFAKAHFLTVDTTYQLSVCHWLRTHASVEPIIMAARRHLSTLHPLHAMLAPHFKDTINLNAEGRTELISANGRIEKNFAAGKYSMEMVCQEYKKWRFDEQSLPNDLLSRGVAVKDPKAKHGVRLTIKDYPYAADGLDLWEAINQWVKDYVKIYYTSNQAVQADEELQGWWSEVKEVAHGDHAGAQWWSKLNTIADLEDVIATLIWVTSGYHASVNFGNYAYGGYVPNSPGMARKFIPEEGTPEWEEMWREPEKFYMDMIPSQGVATITMATFEALAHHVEDEEYLGQRPDEQWTNSDEASAALEEFRKRIQIAEVEMLARNEAYRIFHHRAGPVLLPYTLLVPSSGGATGITFRGVPNSISM